MSQIEVDKIIPQSGTSTQLGESGDTITIPAGATIANNGTATGFDTDTNDKVKVSTNDTTPGFLNGKLVAGTNISLTEGSDGGNETLTAALTGTIATAQIANDAITLDKMASGTDGNIISYDASGNPVAVATGSAGQVLTSAGAGAPPTFADAGGGAYEKLVTTSITSGAVSNITFDNTYITSTYRDYRIVCSDFEVSADSELRMTISDDNGSSFKSGSNYRYASRAFKSDATTNNRAASGNTNFIITADNMKDGGSPSDHTSSIIIDIFNPLNTNTCFSAAWRGFFTSASSLACGLYGGGFYNADASSSFNAVKLVLSSGNFELGSYTLYGRKI